MDLAAKMSFFDTLPRGWQGVLSQETEKDYFKKLCSFLDREYQSKTKIFPERRWVLRALQLVDFEKVKVVVLGQDPYHGEGQAIGLSFGVPNALQPKPPSLQNILKELASDLGVSVGSEESDLTGWAEQGVLLLNTVLTVREAQAFSHREAGWETLTDQIIERLNEREAPVLFVLWGAAAQKKKALITHPRHFILESSHPSPLSAYRGFLGSRPFSKINSILATKLGLSPIDWGRISSH